MPKQKLEAKPQILFVSTGMAFGGALKWAFFIDAKASFNPSGFYSFVDENPVRDIKNGQLAVRDIRHRVYI